MSCARASPVLAPLVRCAHVGGCAAERVKSRPKGLPAVALKYFLRSPSRLGPRQQRGPCGVGVLAVYPVGGTLT